MLCFIFIYLFGFFLVKFVAVVHVALVISFQKQKLDDRGRKKVVSKSKSQVTSLSVVNQLCTCGVGF